MKQHKNAFPAKMGTSLTLLDCANFAPKPAQIVLAILQLIAHHAILKDIIWIHGALLIIPFA